MFSSRAFILSIYLINDTQMSINNQTDHYIQKKDEANGSFIAIAALKMTLITCIRVGSLVALRWDKLDENQDLWIVPDNRMKNKQDHMVSLTKSFKELLEKLHQVNVQEEYDF